MEVLSQLITLAFGKLLKTNTTNKQYQTKTETNKQNIPNRTACEGKADHI